MEGTCFFSEILKRGVLLSIGGSAIHQWVHAVLESIAKETYFFLFFFLLDELERAGLDVWLAERAD